MTAGEKDKARYHAIILLLSIVGLGSYYVFELQSTMSGADKAELLSTYDRWVEAGRPKGVDMARFLEGRNKNLRYLTNTFTIDNAAYVGILALTNSRSGKGGLIVTIDRQLIRVNSSGGFSVYSKSTNASASPGY
jgi:hypothetical protein